MTIRWKRWLLATAGALALYSLAGFWLLPLLVRHQLPALVQSQLERKATIGEVRFNPYTLRLEAHDLHLAEADGAALFDVGQLVVELNWRSLVRRAWSLAEVRITAPNLALTIAPDGKFNIAELLATLNRKPQEPSSGMPRLIIGHFALEQGKVQMHDHRAGYADIYTPIDFALDNLSTLPDENGTYALSADAAHGGKLSWRGNASLNPIGGSGELTLDRVALPGLAAYLKSFMRVAVTSGELSAKLPYRFSYGDGKFEASLAGAGLALRDLALTQTGADHAFVALKQIEISDVGADLARRDITVGALRVGDGKLALRRDAKGALDLANLMLPSAPAAAPAKAAPVASNTPAPAHSSADNRWKLQIKQVAFDRIGLDAIDETARPALKISAGQMQLHLKLLAEQSGADLKLNIADAGFALADLSLASGAQTPFKLARLGFDDGALDMAGRHISVGRLYADGGELQLARDAKGQLNIVSMLPKSAPSAAQVATPQAPASAADTPWAVVAKRVELNKFDAQFADAGSGVQTHIQHFNLALDDASSDLKQPLKFSAGLDVREGGQLSAQGKVVPATGALDASIAIKQLALAPVQPLLAKYVRLKIAGGSISASGQLSSGASAAKNASLRYAGSFGVAGLVLDEDSGVHFATWKNVQADKLTFSLAPNLLDVAELRVVEPDATLIIANDRSFNAERLLVTQPAVAGAAVPAPSAQPVTASAPFPVRVRRVRFQNAKLDFADLSLRPQFSAKIYELNGVITGLSSQRDARSQIQLDGRVDQYGMARVRGQLNPFVPADNTDLNVVFKNVDMVAASPYSMKFAGYKIAQGKISLDLQYKVRDSQLEGSNQIVLDNLTLGERIDSPDALHLPLELALAILKDQDGRIDLGVPVSGNMNDPEFSYGSVVWKALGNVLGKIVTSPFRALGSLFGVSSDKLETIDFDPGSAVLLPPEREKLVQVAQILSKRAQLKLTVPGQYSDSADGARLKAHALRLEVLTRAGIKLAAGESAGPLNLDERKIRGALRDLYAQRFGAAELDKQKKAAEAEAAAPAAADGKAAAQTLAPWQRLGKLIQGEPQVADASAFYGKLRARLEESQPLPADALPNLGAQRASAVLEALTAAGVDPASAHAGAPEAIDAEAGRQVQIKLGLTAK